MWKRFSALRYKKILPKSEVVGIDLSRYAKKKAIKDIKNKIMIKDARKNLKFKDKTFDLVLSINTLHNFKIPEIFNCLSEIERVGRQKFVCVESFRNEKEQFNLQCWALTAETLVDTTSWKWLMAKSGYTGDYEFIFFFKKIIREIFYTISFIVSLINLIFFLIKVDIKNKKVFLQPEGGFAHTVLTPEVLKRLYPKNEWLIVFGHDPKRHNKLIKDLYLNNFYWLDLSLNINKLSHIKDYYKNKVFLILEYYLKIKKIDYAYYVDFIQKYENFDKKK